MGSVDAGLRFRFLSIATVILVVIIAKKKMFSFSLDKTLIVIPEQIEGVSFISDLQCIFTFQAEVFKTSSTARETPHVQSKRR